MWKCCAILSLTGLGALLVACADPAGSSAVPVKTVGKVMSLKRSEMGHRPGPQGFTTVLIDAGHGGRDSGAISGSTGQQEKAMALDTARRLQSLLAGKMRTVLIRGEDEFVDLDERVRRASQRDGAVLVSIHYNHGPARLRGPETYYWRVDSHGLAVRCQRAMEAVSPIEAGNRGLVRRRLRLTRNPSVPCLLLELGYLSNPAEARLCSQASYRQKMAEAIASALLDQQRLGDSGTGPLPRAIDAPPSRPSDPAGS